MQCFVQQGELQLVVDKVWCGVVEYYCFQCVGGVKVVYLVCQMRQCGVFGYYFYQWDQVWWMLEMSDQQLFWEVYVLCQLIWWQVVGVVGDNCFVGDQCFQFGVQGVFQCQLFGDCFNQQCGIGQGIQCWGGGQMGQYCVVVGGILLIVGFQFVQDGVGYCWNFGEMLWIGVIQVDGVIVVGEMVGDIDVYQFCVEYCQVWCKYSGFC